MPNSEEDISRVRRSKVDARASYDRMSKWYEVLAGSSEKRFIELGLEKIGAQEGEKILEIGFGTGYALGQLAHAVGESGKVYGIDISQGMLERASHRIGDMEFSERVELICDDAEKLPYQDQFFDGIFMSFTLELFDTPEIPKVLSECHRTLRKAGRLCVIAMSKTGNDNLMTRLYAWAHDKIPAYVDCRPIYVRAAIASAGFQIEEHTEATMWALPVEIVLATKT